MPSGARPAYGPGCATCAWCNLGERRWLAVSPEQVVAFGEPGDRGFAAEGCVFAAMVVVVDPAVKGRGAFAAGAVDRAVGPAAQQRADEALRLAIGLRAIGPGAQVTDSQDATGDRVD